MAELLSVRAMIKMVLSWESREGTTLMLQAYFDDSGTHANSRVVVVAGLIGSMAQWEAFDALWRAKLAEPLPGKPPLSKFHLSACNSGQGEFADYRLGERDLVTRAFREIVIEAGLISTASAIERHAWNELVPASVLKAVVSDVGVCIDNCVRETWKIAAEHPEGERIAIFFDRGFWIPELKKITAPYTYPLGTPRVDSINAVCVEEFLPLQGADIVATENYWHALEVLKIGDDAAPRPHFRHYLDHMLHEGFILGRPEIADYLKLFGPDGRPLEQPPS